MIQFEHHTLEESALLDEQIMHMPFVFDTRFTQNLARLYHADCCLLKFKGDVHGCLPALIKKSKLITSITLLYSPINEEGNAFDIETEEKILNALVEYVEKTKLGDRITQPINWALFQSYPKGSVHIPFGTYDLNLSKGEDEVWKGLHSKHRNVIRNAEKKGGYIKTGSSELKVFYSLYESTMQRSNMYCEPFSYFESLMKGFKDQIFCAVVYRDEEPQGAVFVPYTMEGAYYVYGASADKISLTGAINFLHFEMIKFLIEKGVKKYDFVGARLSDISGTKFEGIQKFKKRFGGELKEGVLWKMDINKAKCKIYDAAVKAKAKLNRLELKGDIIDQELKKLK